MASALLCLVMICTPASQQAIYEWEAISATYNLPALTFSEVVPIPSARGTFGGLDPQGRAVVSVRGSLDTPDFRFALAHESLHAMIFAAGEPYGGTAEEQLADAFAYCEVGWTMVPNDLARDCGRIFSRVASYSRWH